MATSPWKPVSDDTSAWKPVNEGPATPPQQPSSFMDTAKNVGIGAVKGLANTSHGLLGMMAPRGSFFNSDPQMDTTPQGTAQTIGKGIEQAGEFAVPIGGPESKLARLGMEAGRGALVNKAQGGSATAGALMGGAGEGLAQGIKAAAPGLAESALNIRKTDRAYKPGGAIGNAILDETRGIRPGTVAESAQGKLNTLTPQLDAAARNSPNTMSLGPARGTLGDAMLKAVQQNEPTTAKQLSPMMSHLNENQFTGRQYAHDVPAIQGLQLKRGFGNEFIHNWNPDTMHGVKSTAAQTYHNLGEEFNNAVPEAKDLNGRISNLIPVAKRGASTELNAPTSQRVAGRVLAHTGAGLGAVAGGTAGYQHGGALGGLVGGIAGLAAPDMIASPEGQMIAARMMHGAAVPGLIRSAGGGLLQADRENGQNGK